MDNSEKYIKITKEESFAANLPLEVVTYLMEFLSYSDRLAASQVCQLWYEASLHPKFLAQEKVVIKKIPTNAVSIFKNSWRTHQSFMFIETDFNGKVSEFWFKISPEVKYLYFGSCDIYDKVLTDLLANCFKLELLVLHDCRELFMPGRLLEDPKDRKRLSKSLQKVKDLSLSCNRYLSDALFNRLISVMPSVHSISLEDCQISYHLGLLRKYYPDSIVSIDPDYASETVLTFHNIYKVLAQRANMIKSINLSRTLADSTAVSMIAQLDNLELEELQLVSCKQLTNSAAMALADCQKSLTILNMSHCPRITDQALLYICSNLTNLRRFSVRNCRAITDLGVVQLKNLINLEELDISHCEQVTGEGVEEGLCSKENKMMRKLEIEALSLITSKTVITIAETLTSLTYLSLSYCFNAVTDSSAQAIFKDLVKLRCLKLANCDALTDAGLTGMGMGATVDNTEIDKAVEEVVLTAPRLYISLRSKAEQEIVQDALRKKAVQKMCETQLIKSSSVGYSLARLKGLQELDLRSCNKITDVSLTYSFHFLELSQLNLSKCQQITHVGLKHVGENNPSVETLSLGHCYNVTDEGIVAVTKSLRRLKYLDIKGCNQLTNVSVDAIVENCHQLRYLDALHCFQMSDRLAAMLNKLPLQTFYNKSEEAVSPVTPPPMVR